jgi:hypothetical protein
VNYFSGRFVFVCVCCCCVCVRVCVCVCVCTCVFVGWVQSTDQPIEPIQGQREGKSSIQYIYIV